ncbi:P-loop containing nucleoside triphosphate hydrolase protein [Ustulina deusta]|nr:P-loop containing nucleoside triphosphate hydrolase protein [Ustulina deusta]
MDTLGSLRALRKLTLSSPFEPIFCFHHHCWENYKEALSSASRSIAERISEFTNILEKELELHFENLNDADKHGVITFSHLWTIFPPGPLVWWDLQQNHSIGMSLETAVNRWSGNFTILCKQNAWNGFAVKLARLEIEPFTGSRPVTGLSAAPLSMKANADEIRTLTLERVSERIVLDTTLWKGQAGAHQKALDARLPSDDDSDLILCSPMLKGHSLSNKKWSVKYLLLGFAKVTMEHMTRFDDLVSGKGKGAIVLLAGPLGVGKTLTAESITDKMRRPFYPLSAADLGISAEMVEDGLRRALTYCEERNELLSIFLRLLEYFKGMMFLTTNRVRSIDPAFDLRIDMTIHYPTLSEESRFRIWENFVGEEAAFRGTDKDELCDLCSHELNGRMLAA